MGFRWMIVLVVLSCILEGSVGVCETADDQSSASTNGAATVDDPISAWYPDIPPQPPSGSNGYEYSSVWTERLRAVRKHWLEETDKQREAALEDELSKGARYSDNEGSIKEELLAGGPIASIEVQVTSQPRVIALKPLRQFSGIVTTRYGEVPVVRRMSRDRFELWTSNTGWLFNASGNLLATAKPPRRDGHGREWYGAFLPDGQWVTTDLWDFDKQLHFFSRDGKWRKSVDVEDIVGWARCDSKGTGWVFSHGARTDPSGKVQPVAGPMQLLAWPRQLGMLGGLVDAGVPSDDGKKSLGYQTAGHGHESMFGTFLYGDYTPAAATSVEPESRPEGQFVEQRIYGGGRNSGFWPGSYRLYLEGDRKTWFTDEEGRITGWIAGQRLADSADGKSMLFRREDGVIVTVTPELRVLEARRFELQDRTPAVAATLFEDLRMGFFSTEGNMVLASWGKPSGKA